jgi:SAM-dependent methyltransferase
MDSSSHLNYWQFRQVGSEQWLAQPDLPRRVFVHLFGPLGVHARIRNARVINAIRKLELPPDTCILDAGCGHAYATFWLARFFPGWQFMALELDDKLVKAGELITRQQALRNVRFMCANASDLDAVSAYNIIFSIDLLEHIVDDVGTLKAFNRALQPDGYLLLHLPRRHQEHWRLFSIFKKHTTPDHVRDEYTASEIRAKLEQTGFEVIDLQYGFSRWGEVAFELNYLFWNSNILRTLTALLFHPISTWLAYMDTRHNYADGNSLLVLARPARIMEAS